MENNSTDRLYMFKCHSSKKIKTLVSPITAIQAVIIPREYLSDAFKMPEVQKAGVYILYGYENQSVYIGQSETSVYSRLASHNRKRDFWKSAICFTEKGGGRTLSATHAKALESMLLEKYSFTSLENSTPSVFPCLDTMTELTIQFWAEEIVDIINMLDLPFARKPKAVSLDEDVTTVETEESPLSIQDDSAKPEKPLHPIKQQTPRPVSYTIGDKTYPFVSWRKATSDYFYECKAVYGDDVFEQKVLEHNYFPKGKGVRKTFARTKDEMLGYGCEKIGDIYFLTNFSAESLMNIVSQTQEMFDVPFTLNYENDVLPTTKP